MRSGCIAGEKLAGCRELLHPCGPEVAATQLSMELAYDLVTKDTPQIRRILDQDIVLLWPSHNPDGNITVVDFVETATWAPGLKPRRCPGCTTSMWATITIGTGSC